MHGRPAFRPSDDEWWDAAIDAAVAAGLPPSKVMSPCRDRQLVQTRWRAWRALHERGFSMSGIAYTAGFDHTTVMHGFRQLKKMEGGNVADG